MKRFEAVFDSLDVIEERIREKLTVEKLAGDPALPYGYIAEAVGGIAEELCALPLREVTVGCLEDYGIRLDIVASAAALDGMRAPAYKELLDGVGDFRERIDRAADFFRDLPEDAGRGSVERSVAKKYGDMAFQGNILLFYLKGEVQKLGRLLRPGQRAALEAVCGRLEEVVGRAEHVVDEEAGESAVGKLCGICRELTAQAEELGVYGASVRFIAGQLENMAEAY